MFNTRFVAAVSEIWSYLCCVPLTKILLLIWRCELPRLVYITVKENASKPSIAQLKSKTAIVILSDKKRQPKYRLVFVRCIFRFYIKLVCFCLVFKNIRYHHWLLNNPWVFIALALLVCFYNRLGIRKSLFTSCYLPRGETAQ